MDINQLATETEASAGGGLAPGEYPGVLEGPIQKTWEGKRFWEIPVNTPRGKTSISIWDFDQSDIEQAGTDLEFREKVQAKIARAKRLYVDVGVWSRDLAKSASWSGDDHSIVGCLSELAGRKCTVVVQRRANDPGKTNVFINAPKNETPINQPPTLENHGSAFTGSVPSLDDIPF